MILLAAPLLAAAQTTQHVKVLEYCPAPGQFVGVLPAIDATMSEADRLQACEAQLADQLPVSLGAFGGYITFGFTEPIANTRGSDLRILGNAYYAAADPVYGAATIGGSIEPGIVYAGVGLVGAVYAVRGGITIGQLSVFLSYANQYTKPFNEISGVVTELQNALACAARVFELLDADDQVPEAENAPVLQPDGHVQLQDVSFRYLPDRPLIEGLSLDVKPGQRIAIVGPTGCGKTTLINLLMRFYDVNGGAIKVSGTDIRSVTRASLRGSYGMVLQDTWLRAGTVRENIAYGKPDATLDEVVAAAKAAHADSFIRRLPDGYDTVIAEDGGNISQGQKQLLCIARVMLCLPPMLILDEATSSIDTRTEVRIQKAFARMMQGRTSFIVAHRLSTIREADVILVMKDGHIVEQGDHDQLLAAGGFYAKLYNSQFEGVES